MFLYIMNCPYCKIRGALCIFFLLMANMIKSFIFSYSEKHVTFNIISNDYDHLWSNNVKNIFYFIDFFPPQWSHRSVLFCWASCFCMTSSSFSSLLSSQRYDHIYVFVLFLQYLMSFYFCFRTSRTLTRHPHDMNISMECCGQLDGFFWLEN